MGRVLSDGSVCPCCPPKYKRYRHASAMVRANALRGAKKAARQRIKRIVRQILRDGE